SAADRRHCRLIDDAEPAARFVVEFRARVILQCDDPARQSQRMPGRRVIGEVAIQISPRQCDDYRTARTRLMKLLDAGIASPCMQGTEKIGFLAGPLLNHRSTMAKPGKFCGPANRRNAVT